MSTWTDVQSGDVVLGKDGRAWTVMRKVGTEVTLETDGKPPFTGRPTGEVTVLASAAEEMARAEAQIQVRLGGERIAEQDEQGRWVTPLTFPSLPSALSHLYVLHGVRSWDEGQTLRDWLAEH
ncbi:MAG TPA: hypothetical protein VFU98_19135, partial [Microlunatus sp.]|nr:hypothetical protein [Microlunatus sp.]